MAFNEGKAVKKIEGIPVEEEIVLQDVEKGVDEKQKFNTEKKAKGETSTPPSEKPKIEN